MKKLFTFLFLAVSVTCLNAQRHADLLVTQVNTTGTVTSNVAFNMDCKIKNLGPDAVRSTDSINVYLVINNTLYQTIGKSFYAAWAVNEERQVNILSNFKLTGPQGQFNICSFAYLFNRSTDSISDPSINNNIGCNMVNFVWGAGVQPGTANLTLEGINAYPNPAVNQTKLTYSLGNTAAVKISVKDMTGREVLQVMNEEKTAGQYEENLDLSALKTGVYLVEYQVGDKSYTTKLVKN
jgi:hypothetical protein